MSSLLTAELAEFVYSVRGQCRTGFSLLSDYTQPSADVYLLAFETVSPSLAEQREELQVKDGT